MRDQCNRDIQRARLRSGENFGIRPFAVVSEFDMDANKPFLQIQSCFLRGEIETVCKHMSRCDGHRIFVWIDRHPEWTVERFRKNSNWDMKLKEPDVFNIFSRGICFDPF